MDHSNNELFLTFLYISCEQVTPKYPLIKFGSWEARSIMITSFCCSTGYKYHGKPKMAGCKSPKAFVTFSPKLQSIKIKPIHPATPLIKLTISRISWVMSPWWETKVRTWTNFLPKIESTSRLNKKKCAGFYDMSSKKTHTPSNCCV